MPVVVCKEILEQGAGESILHAIDFTAWLRKPLGWVEGQAAAATLSTLTSIMDQASVLTLANKAINTTDVVPRDMPFTVILASHGVQFRASGGVAGTRYLIKAIVVDSDSNTWECYVRLQITAAVSA